MSALLVVLVGVFVLGGTGDVRALLNLGQVAQVLGCSRTTVWRLVSSGELPSVKITSSLRRVDPEDLERWIDQRRDHQSAVDRAREATLADLGVLPLSRKSDS